MLEKIPGQGKITDNDVVLVTGGSGLFGKAIAGVVERCKIKGKWVFGSSKDCDLTDVKAVQEYFKKIKPTYIIHLAAYVGGLFRNKDPKERLKFWLNNVNINNNVLQTAHEVDCKKVLSCLSTCVFPDGIALPLTEKVMYDGPPHPSNEPYAYAKRMVGLLSKWMNGIDSIKTKYICTIPCNLYGEYDNFNIQQSHVIPGLIHRCYLCMKENKEFVVWGTGKPLRQFLYTRDAAEMTLMLAFNYEGEKGELVSICVGEKDEVTIGDVAKHVATNLGLKSELVFDTSKADGQYQKTTSNEKFMEIFPDYKFTSFEEGIKDTVKWFLDNYDTDIIRK